MALTDASSRVGHISGTTEARTWKTVRLWTTSTEATSDAEDIDSYKSIKNNKKY